MAPVQYAISFKKQRTSPLLILTVSTTFGIGESRGSIAIERARLEEGSEAKRYKKPLIRPITNNSNLLYLDSK